MNCKFILLVVTSILLIIYPISAHDLKDADEFHHHKDWHLTPDGHKHPGDSHGDIAVDQAGLIYLSVQGGPKAGMQVYDKEGKYLKNLPNVPGDLHGFVIHKDDNGEVIIGARLNGKTIVKYDLEGKLLLEIKGDLIPKEFIGKKGLKLTSAVIGPNGDIYSVDGYGNDYIHRFDKEGKYLSSFGGKGEPYKLRNCHKIYIDKRYTPARILCTNRAARSLVHLDLDGKMLGVYVKDLRRPSAVAFWGEHIALAEIEGRITILDKAGKIVKTVSFNKAKYNGNRTGPDKWTDGLVTSPHGISFDNDGNILMSEYNKWGRVLKYKIKK